MTPEIENGIFTCIDLLKDYLWEVDNNIDFEYEDIGKYLWVHHLHKRLGDFDYKGSVKDVIINTIANSEWFEKLDVIEEIFIFLNKQENSLMIEEVINRFSSDLNAYFEELNFGYRVLDKIIVPVTTDGEKKSIEEAIETSENNVRMHLHCALGKLSERPKGDYRNSIKESISAVEAYCRNIIDKDTLGNALAEMEHNGLNLTASLKAAFLKLYGYTNSPDTGIRHPLMDVDGSYVPTADEAIYMLISCSAFINYLRKKSVA